MVELKQSKQQIGKLEEKIENLEEENKAQEETLR